jgi:Cu(I)/Ag(I) efflux system membrane fusion protein
MKKIILYISLFLTGTILGIFLVNSSNKLNDSNVSHNHVENETIDEVWTCSMHPQIRLLEPGSCPICGMELIKLSNSSGSSNEFSITQNALKLSNIQTTKITKGENNSINLSLSGTIQNNEKSDFIQTSYFSGRIEKLELNFIGQKINKGDLIGYIYSPELISAQQELILASSNKENNYTLYNAVLNKLKLLNLSNNQINEIEEKREISEYFPIYSTVSGTLIEKLISEGESIIKGQSLFKVNDLNSVWAKLDIYESDLSLIKKGQKVSIKSPNKEIDFKGYLDFIDPIIDPLTRISSARVSINNMNGTLRPGMFISGEIIIENYSSLIKIPASSVLWTGDNSYVYIQKNNQELIFEIKEVVLGRKIGDYYEILSGLSVGEIIVTNGTFTLDASAQLKGKKSMMNMRNNLFKEDNPDISNNSSLYESEDPDLNSKIIAYYLSIKEQLVLGDISEVIIKGEDFIKLLNENINVIQNNYYDEILYIIKTTEKMIGDSNIEDQRKEFSNISNKMIEIVDLFKSIAKELYINFCPMFNQGEGAYWISDFREIENPFYGSKMLKCGKIEKTLF